MVFTSNITKEVKRNLPESCQRDIHFLRNRATVAQSNEKDPGNRAEDNTIVEISGLADSRALIQLPIELLSTFEASHDIG